MIMKQYISFMKKEFLEGIRTYKFIIILIVFALFGISNPLMAKFTPQILKSVMGSDLNGFNIIIPEPTALDSWGQFFKNISQLGFMLVIIIFSGILTNETSKNTLVNILTKGMPRSIVILSKYTTVLIVYTISYLLAFTLTYVYTIYLFKGDTVNSLIFSVFCLWLHGILLISALFFFSSISKSNYVGLLLTGAFAVIMSVLGIFPKLNNYNPASLATLNLQILSGQYKLSYFNFSIILTLILCCILIFFTIFIFKRKQV